MSSEQVITPSDAAFAVITNYPQWYRGRLRSIKHTDKVRGDLALSFISDVRRRGFHIVVVDGKSAKTFKKELRAIEGTNVLYRSSKKRSPGKRQAIKYASKIEGVKAIILTEPEKTGIVSDCLLQITTPILKGEYDVCIPKRNRELFMSSYPEYMYVSEVEGNQLYNEARRAHGLIPDNEDYDWFFGPRVIKNEPKVLKIIMRRYSISTGRFSLDTDLFDTEEYSNVQYFPFVYALKKKLKVANVEVPFTYPIIQKENEEVGARDAFLHKRKIQRMALLVELLHFLSFLDRNPYSRLKEVEQK